MAEGGTSCEREDSLALFLYLLYIALEINWLRKLLTIPTLPKLRLVQ